MKKTVLCTVCMLAVLACVVCFHVFHSYFDTTHNYLEKEYAKYVMDNFTPSEIPYMLSNELHLDDANTNETLFNKITTCEIWDLDVRLKNDKACQWYMWLLWHSLGSVGYGNIVPGYIVCNKSEGVILFHFDLYSSTYEAGDIPMLDGGFLRIFVDFESGKFLHAAAH